MAIFRLRKKDGSEVWVEDHGRHVVDDKGNVLYHEGVLRDITERMRAEKELNTLAQALRSITECVSITDMENTLIFVNEAFSKTYGYDVQELVGKNISIVSSPNNTPGIFREVLVQTQRGGLAR